MKDLIYSILNIFRYIGRGFTVFRNFLLNIILLLAIVLLIITFIPQEDITVSSNSILNLTISGTIVEEKKEISSIEKMFDSSLSTNSPDNETQLQNILDILSTAAKDDNISVLRLDLKHLKRAGLNQLQSIGAGIDSFKKSGKKVVAAEDFYSQTQYYLASYADTVIINPMGIVDIHGFGVYRLYFKQALDTLKITYNIFKVGTHKSFLEPFTRNDMSSEDRKQNEVWLSALWEIFTDDISSQRNISKETLRLYTNDVEGQLRSTNGDSAQLALNLGLVDKISTRQEIKSYLLSISGTDSLEKPSIFSSKEYLGHVQYEDDSLNKSQIGIIVAEGNIVPGTQPTGVIGGDSLSELIRKAKKDDNIKAIVLRINFGGGSAFASEIIRQELLELQKKGKPVVVSMGTVAASGGYWIAADADEIWASPSTITGSIGIFGAIPTFEKSLASLGVFSDGIGTTPVASGLNLSKPLPEPLKSAIQLGVNNGYDQFLTIVADGRNMERSHVEKIAEGQVFDGITAKSIGLVDKLGTLKDAVNAAAKIAGITEFKPVYLQKPVPFKSQFFQYLITQVKRADLWVGLPISNPFFNILNQDVYGDIETLLKLKDPQNIFTYSFISPYL